jgi:hypothetical protein
MRPELGLRALNAELARADVEADLHVGLYTNAG